MNRTRLQWVGASIAAGALAYVAFRLTRRRSDAELIRENWAIVSKDFKSAGEMFYATLFELDSQQQAIFANSDLPFQSVRLMQMIDAGIRLLDKDTETLSTVLENLGARHVYYKTKPEHYPVAGRALILTLKKTLGANFTPEHERAWKRFYGFVQQKMLKGAGQSPPAS